MSAEAMLLAQAMFLKNAEQRTAVCLIADFSDLAPIEEQVELSMKLHNIFFKGSNAARTTCK
eukprot:3844086-Karenia_brevis.AAC.3